MNKPVSTRHIGIIGGGPSALWLLKRLVEHPDRNAYIDIFEKRGQLGVGMPYGHAGANDEHITNVSDNEIPKLLTSIADWIKTEGRDTLNHFGIDPEKFNEYKVLPRLLFGRYLSAQFNMLLHKASELGLTIKIHYHTEIADIIDQPSTENVSVITTAGGTFTFNRVVICTGHRWPCKYESEVPGYYDSPYPPSKIELKVNHAVGIRGASLTAIDAIRTLARQNGTFSYNKQGIKQYELNAGSANFRMVLHSRNGLLPAVRFHLEDSHLAKEAVLSPEEIRRNQSENGGFLSLDYVFSKNFKERLKDRDPALYQKIGDMQMEAFVEMMMQQREQRDAFELLQAEYDEAERSIKKHRSVYWKEMLGVLSFAMNYPAKYFSAEDMQRLQKTLMPLISIVIAYTPQSSVEDLLALHYAGVLSILETGDDSQVEAGEHSGADYYISHKCLHYDTFIDCIGQPHLNLEDIPFPGLLKHQTISRARLRFRDPSVGRQVMEQGDDRVELDSEGRYWLCVPGIAINDCFEIVNNYGAYNERICIMAVPFMGGYNPDYSGLDFCEAASGRMINNWLKNGFITDYKTQTIPGITGLKSPGTERGAA